ncbi:MAG: Trk system potassium transporter TrkA [Clostridia bacterium]|jgi:trk system potassium uptake protein TrkA|nr:Trk system potassium transporter TrkA [Clostridia bacterium]MDH7572532.1 Trk system potassium transporter TrkA [Clostridia bacterium]
MRIIIVGAGKVGFKLAEMLSQMEHEVVMVDEDRVRCQVVEKQLDVQTVCGQATSPQLLREIGAPQTDLLVAVTGDDETNLVIGTIAKQLGVGKVVARVSNPDYLPEDGLNLGANLGIDLLINPEQVTAAAIAKLLQFPEAEGVEYCAGGRIQLLELTLTARTPVINRKLRDLPPNPPYLIVGIIRGDRVIIPRGQDELLAGDRVFVLAPSRQMEQVEHFFGQRHRRTQNVMVVGGTGTAHYLAKELAGRHIELKIIDKDLEQCEAFTEKFPSATVIHGDGTDVKLMEEEGVDRADLFAALTPDDKVNLLVCLLAKTLGAKKVLAQVRRSDYAHLMQKVGVDVVVSPRLLTAAQILQFIHYNQIAFLSFVGQDKAEMIEFLVTSRCPLVGKPLKEAGLPRNTIIGAIVRGEEVLIPRGKDALLAGDHAVVLALPDAVPTLERIFCLEGSRGHGLPYPGQYTGKSLYYR